MEERLSAYEPALEEVLSDPIVLLLMGSDGVTSTDLEQVIAGLRKIEHCAALSGDAAR